MTYDFDIPTPHRQIQEGKYAEHKELFRLAWNSKRIGLAVSESIHGPWKRADQPLLQPRPGDWDGLITSNPAAAIREDGYTLLIYKSKRDGDPHFHLGAAGAPHPDGPYTRLTNEPIFPYHVEDPSLWWDGKLYHLLIKDFNGNLCGEEGGGAYAYSHDGIQWRLPADPRAYSRTIRWATGATTTHGNVERPSLLVDHGTPTHLFAAISDGPRPHWQSQHTYNVCIPLRHL